MIRYIDDSHGFYRLWEIMEPAEGGLHNVFLALGEWEATPFAWLHDVATHADWRVWATLDGEELPVEKYDVRLWQVARPLTEEEVDRVTYEVALRQPGAGPL